MILKRFYDEKLAQASYMVGCAATGEALLVDPLRDVLPYIEAAEAEGLRITHVTETHIHADFVSGSRELAQRTGAALYLSGEGGREWSYRFADSAGAVLLRDGDRFRVGNVRIDVLHTPGHTPEHLTFLVTDAAAADRPIGALTGDFLFVGDVGRPDLLERAAGLTGTMDAAARTLFGSIQRFKEQPDWLQIWPGHGAGSACGKGLSAIPHSTVGYERLFNWGLATESEDDFVRGVLEGQPEPPKYFAQMKRINRDGPPLLGSLERPRRLAGDRLPALLDEGALVVDTRPADDYAAEHIPGTLGIPLNRAFSTWAGWLLPYDRDFYLLVDERERPGAVDTAVHDLAMIGLDRVAGSFGTDAFEAWARLGRMLAEVPQIHAAELARRLASGDAAVVDVRGEAEWREGHLPGSANIPVGYLPDRLAEVPRDRDVVVTCQSGSRSAIAASVLRREGLRNVVNLRDGYDGWRAAGKPVEK